MAKRISSAFLPNKALRIPEHYFMLQIWRTVPHIITAQISASIRKRPRCLAKQKAQIIGEVRLVAAGSEDLIIQARTIRLAE